MYTISGGRRLYKQENGKYKLIKRNHVFEDQKVTVLLSPMRLKKYSKNIYIEKELSFNDGSGNYRLVNSRPRVEQLQQGLLISVIVLFVCDWLLMTIDDWAMFDVSLSLQLTIFEVMGYLSVMLAICMIYLTLKYEQYVAQLNDCYVVKEENNSF